MPQPLSSKDSSLFRQVVRHCENKQYKKGLKAAEQILRKNPNHGDTLAMKALMLSYQGQQEEAFSLAKMALKNDMKSHICWHVYGLLYRAEKNYDEAIKAYRFALKLEPESQPIQRDLANLQAQIRDFNGYIQSRQAMLQQKPGFRQNWTALAIAYHLAGNLTEAENVLTTYEETLKTPPPRSDMDHSEAILYKNSIIAESGNIEKALAHLDTVSKQCFDTLAVMEMRADYLLQLGKNVEASAAYEALLERNPENSLYYEALVKAKNIPESDHRAVKALYDQWVEKHPRGDAPRRIPLDFLEGDDFRHAVDVYLQRILRKGIPSAFANIKSLYTNSTKRDIVQEVVEGYASGGLKGQVNGSAGNEANGDESTHAVSVYSFLAQHYDYFRSRDLEKAMAYIDKALELCPKSVECYMTKARIWKHHGNISKAAEIMEAARLLDERDRYINSKAVKYQLRNDENEKALDNMSKFTRNETTGGALGDLHEMQCVWFLTEDGESYLRQRKIGLALKRFHAVYNIFDVWQEDQFDFHNFSLRKGMIRAYVDMIRWENHLRKHPYYNRAALGAIKAYLLLYDEPELAHGPIPNGKDGASLDANDRKKVLKKARKEQQKLEKAEKMKTQKAAAAGINGDAKKEDTDPLGQNLAHTLEPLKEAKKFLTPLLEHSPTNIDVQTTGFEISIRRKRYLLALKCLLSIYAIDPANPTLHTQIIRFRQIFDKDLSELPLPPDFVNILEEEFESILPKATNLKKWNDDYLALHSHSAAHVRAAATVNQLLELEPRDRSERMVMSTIDLETASISDGLAGLRLLEGWGSPSELMASFSSHALQKWSQASVFSVN
ncbi:hypothetical protein FQN57_002908 [Myotisia sp. PD_48]|nr:hypothetical protein FQN57_002908 [Myotisia sp. PD_48]